MNSQYSAWYTNNQLHRENGPAVTLKDGTKQWWIEGVQLTEEQFNNRTKEYEELWRIEDEDNEQVFILRYYADCKAYILETQTPYWTDKTAYYTLDNAAAAIGEQCSVFYLTFEPSTQAA